MDENSIKYLDRASGEIITETVMGDRALRFAYNTLLGRSLWAVLFGGKAVSALMGRYYDSPASRKDIAKLAAIPGCCPDEAEYPMEHYESFNSFFARRLKSGARPVDNDEKVLTSPADGRIIVHTGLKPDDPIPVKGAKRSMNELCKSSALSDSLAVAVIRLAPVDYHRYHYPCSCVQSSPVRKIKGKYHSVNPVALAVNPDVYTENARNITALHSDVFGDFYYIEVGAFGVGSIVQTAGGTEHAVQDEKGYFKFGGSTVVLIVPGASFSWAADLQENSRNGVETLIRCGEDMGRHS